MPEGQISVISVPVRDQDRAKAFYVDKLGFEVVSDSVESSASQGGDRWVLLKPSGSKTSITLVTWFKSMKPGCLKGLVLSVADIEVAIADLRKRGIPLGGGAIQNAPWGRWVSVDDPDGNGWIIQQDLLMESAPESPSHQP